MWGNPVRSVRDNQEFGFLFKPKTCPQDLHSLEENQAGQKQIKALESLRTGKRRALFDAQDEIDHRREQLIAEIESRLVQKVRIESLFTLRWEIK